MWHLLPSRLSLSSSEFSPWYIDLYSQCKIACIAFPPSPPTSPWNAGNNGSITYTRNVSWFLHAIKIGGRNTKVDNHCEDFIYRWLVSYFIKGPFCDSQTHSPPPFFSKKVSIFTSAEAFRYIMSVCKIFLQTHLFGEIIAELLIHYADIIITSIVAYATVWDSKTCLTKATSELTENLEISLLIFAYIYWNMS